MSNLFLKMNARELRQKGKTYSEIQNLLSTKIPKSTLSYWLSDIAQSTHYKDNVAKINRYNLELARKKALEVNSIKRLKYLENLKQRNIDLPNKIDKSVQKIMLAILYLGEGGKYKSSKKLSFASSNSSIIKFFLILLRTNFQIDENRLRARVQCRYDQNSSELELFWQKIVGINRFQFYPTYVDMRTKGKQTLRKDYKGVCSIYYHSTEIQLELEILANSIMEHVIISSK